MGCALQHVSFLRGKFSSILLGIDEAISLRGIQASRMLRMAPLSAWRRSGGNCRNC